MGLTLGLVWVSKMKILYTLIEELQIVHAYAS